jgi:PhzF family phenazine biosynthesis protein
VFGKGDLGGNPVAVLRDPPRRVTDDLPALARRLEMSVVVVTNGWTMRFASTASELSMCGHGCLGAAWLLAGDAAAPAPMMLDTPAGLIACRARDGFRVSIGLPSGGIVPVPDAMSRRLVQQALNLEAGDMHDLDLLTAGRLRPKTLVPLKSARSLETLSVRPDLVREVCVQLNSTGLYPFAPAAAGSPVFVARQFPASGGEDAATGTAAAALMCGLRHWRSERLGMPRALCIEQGEQMARPCRLIVEADAPEEGDGRVWLSGHVARNAAWQEEATWQSI